MDVKTGHFISRTPMPNRYRGRGYLPGSVPPWFKIFHYYLKDLQEFGDLQYIFNNKLSEMDRGQSLVFNQTCIDTAKEGR